MNKLTIVVFRKVLMLLAAAACLHLQAAGADAGQPWYPYESGLGADGYDVVAYFVADEAQKGSRKFSLEHQGVKWYFGSEANLEAFKADPGKYLPQYGGYCAYAMGNGYQAFGDPQVWAVHEGRLFFNYNPPIQKVWKVERDELIPAADENWSRLVGANSNQ